MSNQQFGGSEPDARLGYPRRDRDPPGVPGPMARSFNLCWKGWMVKKNTYQLLPFRVTWLDNP